MSAGALVVGRGVETGPSGGERQGGGNRPARGRLPFVRVLVLCVVPLVATVAEAQPRLEVEVAGAAILGADQTGRLGFGAPGAHVTVAFAQALGALRLGASVDALVAAREGGAPGAMAGASLMLGLLGDASSELGATLRFGVVRTGPYWRPRWSLGGFALFGEGAVRAGPALSYSQVLADRRRPSTTHAHLLSLGVLLRWGAAPPAEPPPARPPARRTAWRRPPPTTPREARAPIDPDTETLLRVALGVPSHEEHWVLPGLLFVFDEARLTPGGEVGLSALEDALRGREDVAAIVVVGHADEAGDEAYNLALSRRRAELVAARLGLLVPAAEVHVHARGESEVFGRGAPLDRRVVVRVLRRTR